MTFKASLKVLQTGVTLFGTMSDRGCVCVKGGGLVLAAVEGKGIEGIYTMYVCV